MKLNDAEIFSTIQHLNHFLLIFAKMHDRKCIAFEYLIGTLLQLYDFSPRNIELI